MSDNNAKITLNGNTFDLPIYYSSIGHHVIDVGALLKNNHFTYDNGFVATAACESKITFIDGDKGVLLHRGYPIEELAEKKHYLENAYLILNGELAGNSTQNDFNQGVYEHRALSKEATRIINAFNKQSHPMAILMGILSQEAAIEASSADITDASYRKSFTQKLIGQFPTWVAAAYRHTESQPLIQTNDDLDYAENFLYMLFKGKQDNLINPTMAKALDRIFTLHADHEQNASTASVRLVGSTQTNPYAAIIAGVAALWGPSHGGANEACLKMLKEIGDVKNIADYVNRAKDKNDPFRLMGFGHRVYKNYDPRAVIMRDTCHEVLSMVGADNDPLLKIAIELERIALEDPYFVEKKLYPNVDFYSGITLSAMSIPVKLFTPIFALARAIGWASQWHEMLSGNYRIGRPRQWYTGATLRHVDNA